MGVSGLPFPAPPPKKRKRPINARSPRQLHVAGSLINREREREKERERERGADGNKETKEEEGPFLPLFLLRSAAKVQRTLLDSISQTFLFMHFREGKGKKRRRISSDR